MKTVAFFDIDDTLICGQTQKLLISYFYKKRKVSSLFLSRIYLWFFLYKIGIVSKGTSLMEKAYSLAKNVKEEEFKNFVREVFNEDIKPLIYPQAVERIDFHKKNYHEIVLISKSCKFLVDTIKDYLKVSLSIATELEVKNQVLTGKIKGNIIHGKEKLRVVEEIALKKDWNLKESYAYGDHISDLPLLKAVGHPIVINPDKKLEKEARKRGWKIYFWKL